MCRLFKSTDRGGEERELLVQVPLDGNDLESAAERAKAYATDKLEEMFAARVISDISFGKPRQVRERGVYCVQLKGSCKISSRQNQGASAKEAGDSPERDFVV